MRSIWAAALAGLVAANLIAARRSRRKRYGDAPLGRLASRRYRVGELRVHAVQSVEPHADGVPPAVLVHGLGASSRYMVPIARHLAPHLRVYAPDLPGFGTSDKPGRILDIRELADALAAWMDAAGLERVALIGNSMGCEIAVDLALRHPGRVTRLVLQGPTPDPAARSAWRQACRLASTSLFERSPLIWILALDYARCGIRRYLRNMSDMLADPIERKLPLVDVPTLVVRGTRDRIVPQIWAEQAACLLPDGRLAVIAGAAHAINFSYPVEFRRVVLPFLLEDASTG